MPRNCVAAVFTPGTRYIGVIKTHGSPVCLWDYYDRALKTSAVGFGGWQKPGAQACTILLGPQLFDSLARHGRKFRFDPRTGTISVEGFHKRHTGIFRTRFVVIHRSSGKREVVPVSVGFSIYGPVGRLLKFEREWVVLNPRVPLLPEKRFWRQSRLPGLKIRKVNYHFFYKSCTPAPDPRGKVGVHAVARERRFTDWAVGKKHGQRIIRWVNGGLWKSGPASTFGGAAK
jgi:hypothetical protein